MPKGRKKALGVSQKPLTSSERILMLEAQRVAHIGCWEWDVADDKVRWSDELCRIVGIERHQFGGNYAAVLELLHPDDRATLQEHVDIALKTGQPFELQHRICLPDGSVRTLRSTGAILTGRGGIPEKMIGTAQDVTSQINIEEQRRVLEEQLRNVQKMEALGQLAGGIAHDFNNLLVGIRGYSELLQRRLPEDSAERRLAVQIHDTSNRAALLTQQLVTFSRTQVLACSVINLNQIVCELEELLERTIGEDVELVKLLEPELWLVKVDGGQISQVILNLAVNARDAMPNGGRLTIETKNVQVSDSPAISCPGIAPGEYIKLTVSDNGVGMEEHVKSRLFEPFFTTKPMGKGTGLGLATSYGIVEQSGGHIRVESALHRGTAFEIFVPRCVEAAQTEAASKESDGIRGGSETILVVDDSPQARDVTSEFLRELGYQVLQAENGAQALTICETHREPLHLIVADVVMPRMSGPRLAKRARTVRQDFNVLFISGYPNGAAHVNGDAVADANFLKKPYSQKELAQKVRAACDQAKARTVQ